MILFPVMMFKYCDIKVFCSTLVFYHSIITNTTHNENINCFKAKLSRFIRDTHYNINLQLNNP